MKISSCYISQVKGTLNRIFAFIPNNSLIERQHMKIHSFIIAGIIVLITAIWMFNPFTGKVKTDMPSENKTRSEFTNHCKYDEFDPIPFLWLRTAVKTFRLQIFVTTQPTNYTKKESKKSFF
ncbi:MAG TPA: hypothetical protein ENK14_11300 [Caldithrix sp.]|nr:hypothetical protein [Caldithrix sp.]